MPSRSRFLCLAPVALLCLAAGTGCGVPSEPGRLPQRPSFLVILADDLGWADVGYQGSRFHRTPRIDELARSGMVFWSSYASSPVCSPTRYSLLTGQHPARHGMTKALNPRIVGQGPPGPARSGPADAAWWEPVIRDRLAADDTTIAERLHEAGYATAWIGKWHLGGSMPEEHGFEHSVGAAPFGGPASYFSPYGLPTLPDGPEGEYATDRLTDEAVAFLRSTAGRPFFLVLSHFAPHSPWQAKPDKVAFYEARADPEAPQHNPVYAAMIESLDESVGRIADELVALGIDRKTLLVFTSDNGALTERWLRRKSRHRTLLEITSNAPLRGGKGKLYEGGIRVPTVVRWPGIVAPGSRCDVPVQTTDLYPTFLALAGLEPRDEPLDGLDITPLLLGRGSLERSALTFHFPHQTRVCALRRGDLKLVHFFDGRTELYDLADDLGEAHDLAPAKPELAAELREQLLGRLRELGAAFPVRNPAYPH